MKFGRNSTTEKSARFSKPPFPWHYFQLKDQKVFGFAGLYDVWKDRETGKEIHSYTGSVSVKLVTFTLLDIIRNKKPAVLIPERHIVTSL
jgi:putative SOS response-associated peptidase YedK